MNKILLILMVLLFFSPPLLSMEDPPLEATMFLGYEVYTDSSPSVPCDVSFVGMEDEMYVFEDTYNDGPLLRVHVHGDFGDQEAAKEVASLYAVKLGRQPRSLRFGIDKVFIFQEEGGWGASRGRITIRTETYNVKNHENSAANHELMHANYDGHGDTVGFLKAKAADLEAGGGYISHRARNMVTEEMAELAFACTVARLAPEIIGEETVSTIMRVAGNRCKYLWSLGLDAHPFEEKVTLNAGFNDAWFYPPTAGQGFFIVVYPDIQKLSLAWFTYDTELPPEDVVAHLGDPGHRWFTALGDIEGSGAVLEGYLTRGGVFDSGSPQPTVESYGTITVDFIDCNEGVLEYDFPEANLVGIIPIQRIAHDNIPLCEFLVNSGGRLPMHHQ